MTARRAKFSRFFYPALAGALLLFLLFLAPTGAGSAPPYAADPTASPVFAEAPRVRLFFYRAGEDEPIDGVTVVFPQTGKSLVADSGAFLSLPAERDVTLLFYKEGHVPVAVYHLSVAAEHLRTLRYALYTDDGTLPFVVYSEAPEESETKSLLERFHP